MLHFVPDENIQPWRGFNQTSGGTATYPAWRLGALREWALIPGMFDIGTELQ